MLAVIRYLATNLMLPRDAVTGVTDSMACETWWAPEKWAHCANWPAYSQTL